MMSGLNGGWAVFVVKRAQAATLLAALLLRSRMVANFCPLTRIETCLSDLLMITGSPSPLKSLKNL